MPGPSEPSMDDPLSMHACGSCGAEEFWNFNLLGAYCYDRATPQPTAHASPLAAAGRGFQERGGYW